jgi:hypothetical protein
MTRMPTLGLLVLTAAAPALPAAAVPALFAVGLIGRDPGAASLAGSRSCFPPHSLLPKSAHIASPKLKRGVEQVEKHIAHAGLIAPHRRLLQA